MCARYAAAAQRHEDRMCPSRQQNVTGAMKDIVHHLVGQDIVQRPDK